MAMHSLDGGVASETNRIVGSDEGPSDQELISDFYSLQQDMMGFLIKRNYSPQDAEDIIQDAAQKVFVGSKCKAPVLSSFDRSKSFRTWIFTILKNCAVDHSRKLGRKKRIHCISESSNIRLHRCSNDGDARGLDLDLLQDTHQKRPIDALIFAEQASALWNAVGDLGSKYGDNLTRHVCEEKTINQISEVDECAPRTVAWRCYEATRVLRMNPAIVPLLNF